jgi:hypothetical protein
MAAAARSVGIPVRIAGCSQSIPGDDHHWVEFYDPTSPGPFNTSWHTKEGTSQGNAGGPWDSPSGPMAGCLKNLIPHDKLALNTIWASSWSSPTYMPLQWTNGHLSTNPHDHRRSLDQEWSFVGGENLCGAYCQAWGCGQNQTDHWAQAACAPPAL